MTTYQDLLAVGDTDAAKIDFVYDYIQEHKSSELYQTANIADEYYRHLNRTILQYEKTLVTATGRTKIDQWSPNHKQASNFFFQFVTLQNQYLLGNGVRWAGKTFPVPPGTPNAAYKWVWDSVPKEDTNGDLSQLKGHYEYQATFDSGVAEKLGADFDNRLIDLGEAALIHGVSFAYYNHDHVEVFKLLEFAPLYDEENGALKAGVRFWQIDGEHPLRATLYELDGYTEYIWNRRDVNGKQEYQGTVLHEKRPYIQIFKGTKVDGIEIYDGKNYDSFPIVPLWCNKMKQSEFVGLQEGIDAYDLILNGFENELDNATIYWLVRGAGGSSNEDLVKLLDRIRATHIAAMEEGQDVQPYEVNIPYAARETLLNRIKSDLFADFMSFDITNVSASTDTATGIRAMYTAIDLKCDLYENCVTDFILRLLKIVGVQDKPTYKRNQNINKSEEIDNLLKGANYVDQEYITRAFLSILGDADQADAVLMRMDMQDAQRMSGLGLDTGEENGNTENDITTGNSEQ